MAKLSTDELLDAFKELSLIELSDFVKKFEEVFEVTAAPPPSPSQAPPPRAACAAAGRGEGPFDVVIEPTRRSRSRRCATTSLGLARRRPSRRRPPPCRREQGGRREGQGRARRGRRDRHVRVVGARRTAPQLQGAVPFRGGASSCSRRRGRAVAGAPSWA